jgi:hypothetical protein
VTITVYLRQRSVSKERGRSGDIRQYNREQCIERSLH